MDALKRNAITFGITFCISILIFGLIAYVIMTAFFIPSEKKEAKETVENELILGFEDPDASKQEDGSSFTILLVGTDYQPRVLPDAPSRADQLLFIRYSCEKDTVVYMNIPSITRIKADGLETTLSKVYTEKGIEYLVEKIQGITGININYYAVASLSIFDEIIDELGGVEYDVPVRMIYEDPAQDLEIDLRRGEQDLDGNDVSDMLRYSTDSYTERMYRNTDFFKTLLEKYTQTSYKDEAEDIFDSIIEYVITNFTEEDLIKHLETIYSYASFDTKILTFPGEFTEDNNDYFFDTNPEEVAKMLSEYKHY